LISPFSEIEGVGIYLRLYPPCSFTAWAMIDLMVSLVMNATGIEGPLPTPGADEYCALYSGELSGYNIVTGYLHPVRFTLTSLI
jgi:hypothetical protein